MAVNSAQSWEEIGCDVNETVEIDSWSQTAGQNKLCTNIEGTTRTRDVQEVRLNMARTCNEKRSHIRPHM